MRKSILDSLRGSAIETLSAELAKHNATRALESGDKNALEEKLGQRPVAAWATHLLVDDVEKEVVVSVDSRFPFSPPSISLLNENLFLEIPHVESSGKLCLLPGDAAVSPQRIPAVIDDLLATATGLLSDGLSGRNKDDFIKEFSSYWDRRDPKFERPFLLGCDPPVKSMVLAFAQINLTYYFNLTIEQCRDWFLAFHSNKMPKAARFASSVFLSLDQPLFPEDYPDAGRQVGDWIRSALPDVDQHIAEAIDRDGKPLPIVFGFPTENGPAIGGILLRLESKSARSEYRKLRHGFRKATQSASHLIANAFLAQSDVLPASVQLVGPSYLKRRGGTGEAQSVDGRRVVIIGCGSIGADVAVRLAKMGVTHLTLIDHDNLAWDNLARHVLGAADVGKRKDKALMQHIRSQLPHCEVQTHSSDDDGPLRWEEVFQKEPDVIRNADLVVALTGSWEANAALNMVAKREEFPPVIYGWSEPYGCAGHALSTMPLGGCLSCGMTDTGLFTRAATCWADGAVLKRITACGDFYTPYGMNDTAAIRAIIAQSCMDVLFGVAEFSEIRSYIASDKFVIGQDGTWTQYALKNYQPDAKSSKIFQSEWPLTEGCPVCAS